MRTELKILSWNINSIRQRISALNLLINKYNPDIILLQELKCQEKDFPDVFPGYYKALNCQKSYNGVGILSKFKHLTVNNKLEFKLPYEENASIYEMLTQEARFIEIKIFLPEIASEVIVASVYVPNGGPIPDVKQNPHFAKKIYFLESLKLHLQYQYDSYTNIIIGGDFNVAPFSIDVHDSQNLTDAIGFTLSERMKMRSILYQGFMDNLRICKPEAKIFSWWDYRRQGFQRDTGWRIDFILSTAQMANRLIDTTLDKEIRQLEKPSDHIPIISTYILAN